jgi:hypothetical protein
MVVLVAAAQVPSVVETERQMQLQIPVAAVVEHQLAVSATAEVADQA